MRDKIKESFLDMFRPTPAVEIALPEPPDISIEVVVCPHCEGTNCEVWSTTEARMAGCPDCGCEFNMPVVESQARSVVTAIMERRARLRRRAISSDVLASDAVKAEVDRIFSQ